MTSAAADTLLAMNIRRNPAPVVGDGDRTVGIERHRDARRVAGQRLVDGVIDDLIDHVMQAGAIVGIADIHAWTLAHGIEAAQHLDRIGAVIGFCFRGQRRPATRRRVRPWGMRTFCSVAKA